jgi:hypothetical protein
MPVLSLVVMGVELREVGFRSGGGKHAQVLHALIPSRKAAMKSAEIYRNIVSM